MLNLIESFLRGDRIEERIPLYKVQNIKAICKIYFENYFSDVSVYNNYFPHGDGPFLLNLIELLLRGERIEERIPLYKVQNIKAVYKIYFENYFSGASVYNNYFPHGDGPFLLNLIELFPKGGQNRGEDNFI